MREQAAHLLDPGVVGASRGDAPDPARGNVVIFPRPNRQPGEPPALTSAGRPAPLLAPPAHSWIMAYAAAVLALHAGAFLAFNPAPPPLASIGVVSVSVDILLGAQSRPGIGPTRGETSPSDPAPVKQIEPEPQQPQQPQSQSAPEPPKQEQSSAPAAVEPPPVAPGPTEAVKVRPSETKTQPATVDTPRRERRNDRHEKQAALRPAPRANPANDVGVGRSDATSNYPGLINAHIHRYQRPIDTDRERAVRLAVRINGAGQVLSVQVTRGTGIASVDQEGLALIRRASPLPSPPGGRAISLNVPVTFRPPQ